MTTIKRSYKVGLLFDGENPRKTEKQANAIVRRQQQIVQDKIIDHKMVDHAYQLLDKNPGLSGTRGARHLAKKVGDGSNIGQVSTTYALAAVNGAIDRERKLERLFDLFDQYPREAVSWVVFHRTPFIEGRLAKILDVSFDYSRNLVYSAAKNLTSDHEDVILPELRETDFIAALKSKIEEIQQTITNMEDEGSNTTRIRGFHGKLQFLNEHREFLSFCLYHWYTAMQYSRRGHTTDTFPSRWKSLKLLSRHFVDMLGVKTRYSRLFSAIRSVAVHALSADLIETVKKICETVSTRDLVAKPFRKRRTALAPVNLTMGSKFVVTRPGNGKVLTDLARTDRSFSLGIRDPDTWGRIIHAEVQIHNRLHRMLERGARITSLSIRSGDAPGHKVIVTINLKGDRDAFASTRFLDQYNDLVLDQTDIMGLDINRVGPHVVAFSQKLEFPDTLTTICNRYLKLGDEISRLSQIVEKTRSVKHYGELDRVYRRRANLLHEIRNQCKLLTTAVLVQAGVSTLRVEDLQVSARGTRGALAKAILNMPDELDIFEQAVFLAASSSGTEIELDTINPYKTSSIHNNCGGSLLRDSNNWDIAKCGKCGNKLNTHLNAALNIKAGGFAD